MIQLDERNEENFNLDNMTVLKEIELDLDELVLEANENETQLTPSRLFPTTIAHLVLWCHLPDSQNEKEILNSHAHILVQLVSNQNKFLPNLELLTLVLQDDDVNNPESLTLPLELEQVLARSTVECHVRAGNRFSGTVDTKNTLRTQGTAQSSKVGKSRRKGFVFPLSKRYMDFESRTMGLGGRRTFSEYESDYGYAFMGSECWRKWSYGGYHRV